MGEQYSEEVMKHFLEPHNVGVFDEPDGVGKVGNPVCGDIMEIQIKVEDEAISDARFRTFGCGAAIATSSVLTDMVKGRTLIDALTITNEQVTEALGGLPARKRHCSVLAEEGLHAAIKDYKERLHGKIESGEAPAGQCCMDETCKLCKLIAERSEELAKKHVDHEH
jgi:nitrogen fixation protein NifU and related proteins